MYTKVIITKIFSKNYNLLLKMEYCKSYQDIKNSCRLCLVPNANMRSIFANNNNIQGLEDDISSLIFDCTNIKVSKFDRTTSICKLCLQKILYIVKFRKKCLKRDLYFKKYYSEVDYEEEYLDAQTEENNLNTLIGIDYQNTSIIENINKPEYCDDIEDKKWNTSTHSSSNNFKSTNQKQNEESNFCDFDNLIDFSVSYPKEKRYYSNRDPNDSQGQGLCYICGIEFTKLTQHILTHSDEKPEICEICGSAFKSKARLRTHALVHSEGNYPCKVCSKKYRTPYRLKQHMQRHNNDRPFKCDFCDKRFYNRNFRKTHHKTHTGERSFVCKHCDDCFSYSYLLKQHIEKNHQNINVGN